MHSLTTGGNGVQAQRETQPRNARVLLFGDCDSDFFARSVYLERIGRNGAPGSGLACVGSRTGCGDVLCGGISHRD